MRRHDGHTTAKVSAQHGLIYDTLSSKFGDDRARAYAEANPTAINAVESLVVRDGGSPGNLGVN